jgi:hypothetical protein
LPLAALSRHTGTGTTNVNCANLQIVSFIVRWELERGDYAVKIVKNTEKYSRNTLKIKKNTEKNSDKTENTEKMQQKIRENAVKVQ